MGERLQAGFIGQQQGRRSARQPQPLLQQPAPPPLPPPPLPPPPSSAGHRRGSFQSMRTHSLDQQQQQQQQQAEGGTDGLAAASAADCNNGKMASKSMDSCLDDPMSSADGQQIQQPVPQQQQQQQQSLRKKRPSLRMKLGRFGSGRQFGRSGSGSGSGGVANSTEAPAGDEAEVGEDSPLRDQQQQQQGATSATAVGDDLELGELEDPKQSTSSYLKEQFFAFFQPSDNKLAMKLFGNKNALLKEKRRQQQSGKWIIHPCSNFRFYWDLLMLVLLITNLVVLPVAISFFNDDLSPQWIIFNCVSDTIFLSDIAVNFRTGVITNDFAEEIILDPKMIAQHYMKSWFFLDLISSIPMDYIFLVLNQRNNMSQLMHAGRALRILRLAKLLSLLRLLRLSRLVRYVSQWEELLNVASVFMRVANLICLMLLLAHWNGCLQFLVPAIQDFPKDSWVKKLNMQVEPPQLPLLEPDFQNRILLHLEFCFFLSILLPV
ncbi:hypothetical protein BOX15_Mlig019536g1 [Macrostomum lignano]|uniref:Ion_trans domain-containing protein n=1 Tax=Macrostomum lignano TaxID=282301 RepID=A0A267FZC0_9PLAT|nr:hypothetical protein BOX15_Mlig019536g1 [Macrostomum lignano]